MENKKKKNKHPTPAHQQTWAAARSREATVACGRMNSESTVLASCLDDLNPNHLSGQELFLNRSSNSRMNWQLQKQQELEARGNRKRIRVEEQEKKKAADKEHGGEYVFRSKIRKTH